MFERWAALMVMVVIHATVPEGRGENRNVDIERAVRRYFVNDGSHRMSGRGSYIHSTYKKAVDIQTFTEGIKFENEEHQKRYLKVIHAQTGIDFSLTQDSRSYWFERLHFDQQKVRKDVVALSEEQANRIRVNPSSAFDLEYDVYAYDGVKTATLMRHGKPGQRKYVGSIAPSKIWMPQFYRFGLNDSGKDSSIFLDALDKGVSNLSGAIIDGRVHATLSLPHFGIKVELVMEPDKGTTLLEARMFMGGHLVTETICDEYFRCESGDWSPGEYTVKKYAWVNGENVLTYMDKYEAVRGTVDFNIPIDPTVFAISFPVGTYVMDRRHAPPLEFIVESPEGPDFAEPEIERLFSTPSTWRREVSKTQGQDRQASDFAGKAGTTLGLGARTWLEEWGLLAAVLILVYCFMMWLLYRKVKRRKQK